jgi:N-acetylglutamate synthase-like GNAT family acetyltransferase
MALSAGIEEVFVLAHRVSWLGASLRFPEVEEVNQQEEVSESNQEIRCASLRELLHCARVEFRCVTV